MGNERYEQLLDYLDQKRDWVAPGIWPGISACPAVRSAAM